jgi:hypothetical protein
VVLKALQLENVQEHLHSLIKVLRNEEPFHRFIRGRSWELKYFNVSADSQPLEKVILEHSLGIFLSGVEKEMRSWEHHLGNKDFYRTLARGSMDHNDFSRLFPGRWLNDEVINGYVGLLERIKTPGTLVLSGWFWPNVECSTKSDSAVLKVLRHLVSSYLFKFSTTVI